MNNKLHPFPRAMAARRLVATVGLGVGVALASWLAAGSAHAQIVITPEQPAAAPDPVNTPGTDIPDALAAQVRQMALASTGGSEVERPGAPRVEISVGKLDPRLRLAPCPTIEPHMPPGVKLWGKTRIGLRCVDGPVKWNVYLPLTVKVFGRALVAANAIGAATPLNEADFVEAEIDLAAENGPVMSDPKLVVGRTLFGPVAPGQALRQNMLKPRKFFEAGDTVTILADGPGFNAAVEGQAMNNGIEGTPARVKMENGKILTGMPIADHRMDVKL